MKKIIFVAWLVILVGVVLSGCASTQPQKQVAGQEDTKVSAPAEQGTKLQDVIKDNSSTPNAGSVTQAKLDELKADLDKLEAEDLGGLSGD